MDWKRTEKEKERLSKCEEEEGMCVSPEEENFNECKKMMGGFEAANQG